MSNKLFVVYHKIFYGVFCLIAGVIVWNIYCHIFVFYWFHLIPEPSMPLSIPLGCVYTTQSLDILNIFAHPLEIAIYSPVIVVFIEKLGRNSTADFNRPIIEPLSLFLCSLFAHHTYSKFIAILCRHRKKKFFREHKFLYRFSVSTSNAVGGKSNSVLWWRTFNVALMLLTVHSPYHYTHSYCFHFN